MWYAVNDNMILCDGKPFLTLGYTPDGRKKELLYKISNFLNKEQEEKEENNFSGLAHKLSVMPNLEEDDEPAFIDVNDGGSVIINKDDTC